MYVGLEGGVGGGDAGAGGGDAEAGGGDAEAGGGDAGAGGGDVSVGGVVSAAAAEGICLLTSFLPLMYVWFSRRLM